MPLDRFVLGNRETDLRPGRAGHGLRVPKLEGDVRSTFGKLGSRAYLVISIVAVAVVVIVVEDGRVADARVAVGALLAGRDAAAGARGDLVGRPANAGLADEVRRGHLTGLAPIDDVRGTAAYRSDAVRTIVRRALAEVAA